VDKISAEGILSQEKTLFSTGENAFDLFFCKKLVDELARGKAMDKILSK